MSRRWTAKCWMGSNSGYVDIEVNASTISGAKEQLQNIYGAEQITNLREISNSSSLFSSSSSSSGGAWLIGILILGGLFLYLTPWILMTVYGAGATWVSQKVTGQTIEEYAELDDSKTNNSQHKKAAIVFGSALLFGMIGFIQGTSLNSSFNKEYNLDGNQPKVQQLQQK